MILLATILSGLALFQFLVAIEAYRRIRNDTMRWTRIVWYSEPSVERTYQRRQAGVMVATKLRI